MCNASGTKKQNNGFDLLMFSRLWKIMKIIFPRWISIPTSLFFFLLILSFLEQYVGYLVGLISSHYYKVLGDRDLQAFFKTTVYSTLLVLGMATVLTTKIYIANVLYIVWRQILCQTVHLVYFSGINYYSLNVMKKSLDNPDQRMTQDIDKLCLSLSTITITVIIAPFKISYYTYKTYMGTDWVGPVVVFLFFFVGTVMNKLVMSPIVKYYMEQEKQEGNFRFKHMHIRVNSEGVAFHVAGHVELNKTNEALNKLIKIQQTVFNRQFWLNMIQNIFDYMGSIISYMVIAIPIFNGTYDGIEGSDLSSLISKNTFLCMSLMYSFSQLVDLTSSVVELSGVTHRVVQLIDRLHEMQEEWDLQELQTSSSFTNMTQNRTNITNRRRKSEEEERTLLTESDSPAKEASLVLRDENPIDIAFILNKVTISTPGTEKVLINDLSLEITKGNHLLIMGPSSSGKSSLLRVMRGLWGATEGRVAHNLPPGPKAAIFLPQKPILTNGSLYEQIIYPLRLDKNNPPSEDVLNEILATIEKLLLHGLIQRCGGLLNDPHWKWDDILSPGEMQRICFLRLFYHKPQFAFLDESTSGLSLEVEEYLYEDCLQHGITIVSVGHRRSLIKFHKSLVYLFGDGSWAQEEIKSNDTNILDKYMKV